VDEIDPDADGDGILTVDEGGLSLDTDGDGIPNYMDIDSDNDGIVDNVEAQSLSAYIRPLNMDTDGDGLDDAYDADQKGTVIVPVDTDKDEIPDFIDSDSDNDLVPDYIEGHDLLSDGKADQVASGKDSDNDGLDDAYDAVNRYTTSGNVTGSNAAMQDFDGDGMPDWRDENDDDDEYLTRFEDLNVDGDFSNDDTDHDGYPEYLDYGRDCNLFVPNIFTPNNDNIHDYFLIYCINHYPNAKIYIFDQIGNKVFGKDHYGNLEYWGSVSKAWWNGRSASDGNSDGDLVPVGTYYYVLELGNGEVKKSYVFVSY
jgi:gliding motility-associated-like protein